MKKEKITNTTTEPTAAPVPAPARVKGTGRAAVSAATTLPEPAPARVKVRVLKTISHAGFTLGRGAEFTTLRTTAEAMAAAGDAVILSPVY